MPRANKTDIKLVVYNGTEYVAYGDSKYYVNRRDRSNPRLHRQVYIDAYGPIPVGYHVHHIDGNTDNNNIENLVAIPPEKHMRETMAQMREHSFTKKCLSCGKRFEVVNKKAIYCSKKCAHRMWSQSNRKWLNEYNRMRYNRRREINA